MTYDEWKAREPEPIEYEEPGEDDLEDQLYRAEVDHEQGS